VTRLFTQLPRPITWQSFLTNDLPLLKLPDEVKEMAIAERLSKSKAEARGDLQRKAPEKFAQVVAEGGICPFQGLIEWEVRWTTWRPVDGMGPVEWVISQNLERRHLNSSQRAACAVEVLPLLEEEAKQRQREHVGTAPGRPKTLSQPVGQVSGPPDPHAGRATQKAAKRFGSNRDYIGEAKRLKAEDPKSFAAVKAGKTSMKSVQTKWRQREMQANRAPSPYYGAEHPRWRGCGRPKQRPPG
jgi:hypothetical protein